MFFTLMTRWVICTARRAINDTLPLADSMNLHAHDAPHRFLPDGRWKMSRFWQKLTLLLVARHCPKGVITLALDDTLFHHSGEQTDGAGYWRNAVRPTRIKVVTARGLNLVVLILQIKPPWGGAPLGHPINIRLHRKKPKSLIELAVEMIQESHTWLSERTIQGVGAGFWATLAGKPLAGVRIASKFRRDPNPYDLLPKQERRNGRGRPRRKRNEVGHR